MIKMILRKNITGGIVGLVLVVVGSMVLVNNTSATSHTLTLSSSGAQNINITATSNTAISSDSISVATTCRYGYNLVSSTSVNDNNLYLNGDASNNASGTFFSPSDGTTILSNATNTWGYYYNANSAVAPTASSVFSPVPALGNTATIKTPLTTPASADISDSFDIYYGINSAPTMAKGAYKMIPDTNNNNNNGTIVYQATMADSCIKYTVHFNPTSTATGSSVSGTGTMSDQLIAEDIATQLNSNTFTAPNGYYFAGWNTAQDGSGTTYTDSQSVTDLATIGSTITLYAMWDNNPAPVACTAGNICYQPNTSMVTGEMGNQSASDGNDVELYASNFSRAGYGFAGWSDAYDYATNPNANFYGPNQTITVPTGTTANGLSLYAVWIKSAGSLQSNATTACNGLTKDPNDGTANLSSVTALTDERDNQTYAIAKLADGKCWTIENLRLADKDSSNNDIDLDSTNTHNPSLPLNNSWYYKNQQGTLTTSNHLSATSDPTSTSPDTAWCISNSSDCDDQSMLATNNITLFTNNTSSSYSAESNVYSYGNYYNWYSATAGHGKYGSSYGSSYTAPGDICPAGWHLPTGNTTGEYYALNTALNAGATNSTASNNLRSYPNNFVYSGAVRGSSVVSRSFGGFYWSASGNSSNSAYYMYFNSSSVEPGSDYNSKYYGRLVRCLSGA